MSPPACSSGRQVIVAALLAECSNVAHLWQHHRMAIAALLDLLLRPAPAASLDLAAVSSSLGPGLKDVVVPPLSQHHRPLQHRHRHGVIKFHIPAIRDSEMRSNGVASGDIGSSGRGEGGTAACKWESNIRTPASVWWSKPSRQRELCGRRNRKEQRLKTSLRGTGFCVRWEGDHKPFPLNNCY